MTYAKMILVAKENFAQSRGVPRLSFPDFAAQCRVSSKRPLPVYRCSMPNLAFKACRDSGNDPPGSSPTQPNAPCQPPHLLVGWAIPMNPVSEREPDVKRLSAHELLPGVYEDLRRIAAQRIASMAP